jgi:hypothetical protein
LYHIGFTANRTPITPFRIGIQWKYPFFSGVLSEGIYLTVLMDSITAKNAGRTFRYGSKKRQNTLQPETKGKNARDLQRCKTQKEAV